MVVSGHCPRIALKHGCAAEPCAAVIVTEAGSGCVSLCLRGVTLDPRFGSTQVGRSGGRVLARVALSLPRLSRPTPALAPSVSMALRFNRSTISVDPYARLKLHTSLQDSPSSAPTFARVHRSAPTRNVRQSHARSWAPTGLPS
jgi:hypothetical protein